MIEPKILCALSGEILLSAPAISNEPRTMDNQHSSFIITKGSCTAALLVEQSRIVSDIVVGRWGLGSAYYRSAALANRDAGIGSSKTISSTIHSVPRLFRFSSSLNTHTFGYHRPCTCMTSSARADLSSLPLLA